MGTSSASTHTNERTFLPRPNADKQKSARSEIVRKVVDAYPELNDNLAAYGIFRDSILVQSMTTVESATKIAQEYPILIHSAEFVAKTTHAHMSANKISPLRSMESVPEDSSDSSGSEADAAPDAANQNVTRCTSPSVHAHTHTEQININENAFSHLCRRTYGKSVAINCLEHLPWQDRPR